MTRAGFPPSKSTRGNILGDDRTRSNNRIFTYGHPADNRCAGCDPDVSLNHDGLSRLCRGAALRRFKGMAGRDDAHVRPDHHIVRNVEAAKVIESAVLIYEDIVPDANFISRRQYRMAGLAGSFRLPFYR